MEEEKKEVVEVVDKPNEENQNKQGSTPDNDYSNAIHGFGKAASYMFKPGIIASSVTFGASLTCNIISGIFLGVTQDASNVFVKLFSTLASVGWSLFGSLFVPAMIGGIVFHCLTRHFKSLDPKWKDKVDDDNAF